VVECAGLEIRYTVLPYRGFESLSLRQTIDKKAAYRARFSCTHHLAHHKNSGLHPGKTLGAFTALWPILGPGAVARHPTGGKGEASRS
jgi:hypothetical protein